MQNTTHLIAATKVFEDALMAVAIEKMHKNKLSDESKKAFTFSIKHDLRLLIIKATNIDIQCP